MIIDLPDDATRSDDSEEGNSEYWGSDLSDDIAENIHQQNITKPEKITDEDTK
jgi:hypothetical protein